MNLNIDADFDLNGGENMKDVRELISTKKPGVDDETIKSAEKGLGAVFTVQYRDLVRLVNNAEVNEWIFHPIKDPKNLKNTWDDIVRQNLDQNVRWAHMPPDLVAFADNGMGDKLCFQIVSGHMQDTVYIWNHESDEIEQIASNLKEFIQSELG